MEDKRFFYNAFIKNYWIKESEQYSKSLQLSIELETEIGCCVFTVWGPYTEDWTDNRFAYSLKRVMDIARVENLNDICKKPIRAVFKGSGGLGDVIIGIKDFLTDDSFIPRDEPLYQKN